MYLSMYLGRQLGANEVGKVGICTWQITREPANEVKISKCMSVCVWDVSLSGYVGV